MDKKTRSEYDKIEKLSNVITNNKLIKSLEKKLLPNKENDKYLNLKADLLRKSGQLQATCMLYEQLTKVRRTARLSSINEKKICFNSLQLDGGYSTAPLIIVDDFLTPTIIESLCQYVRNNNYKFRKANVDSNNRYYAPDKREALVLDDMEKFKPLFVDFLHDNFDSICKTLEIPIFTILKIEMKITNHVNGGFFRTHADNTALFGKTGRVISWLYYFHKQPKQFDGGDFFAFDTNVDNQSYKDASFTKIEAKHNRFVAFPSCYYHAVSPVNLSSRNVDDGRMAITGHIHFMQSDD